jgi:hypothetical protein
LNLFEHRFRPLDYIVDLTGLGWFKVEVLADIEFNPGARIANILPETSQNHIYKARFSAGTPE